MTEHASAPIRQLTADDAASFREIRLEALRVCPSSFGRSYEEDSRRDVATFAADIPAEGEPGAIFAAFKAGKMLNGISGLHVHQPIKQQHKGMLWGVYVREAARGHGLGEALVAAVIARARTRVAVLQLTVGADNAPARALYERLGFVAYGLERRGLRVDGIDYDEILMALDFENGL
jgi:ribosomal protein S18 acetylase RimI-like enzyme